MKAKKPPEMTAENIAGGSKAAAPAYITFGDCAESRYEEKKSVFIGHAAHIADEDAAKEFIASKRKEYSDASHNCWAYYVADGMTARYSDDGEPQGTAGLPILNVIKATGAQDAVIVVTRYFGGTLLGTGGLARAYTKTAKLAADACGIEQYDFYLELVIVSSYADYEKISAELTKYPVISDDIIFGERVELHAAVRADSEEEFTARLSELSAGRATVVVSGERLDRYSAVK